MHAALRGHGTAEGRGAEGCDGTCKCTERRPHARGPNLLLTGFQCGTEAMAQHKAFDNNTRMTAKDEALERWAGALLKKPDGALTRVRVH